MFKLDRKIIITASVAATVALLSGCIPGGDAQPKGQNSVNGKPTIDGGNFYPVVNDKTGPYYVNPQATAASKNIYNGRVPTANELEAWDKDVMPDGTGLPEGEGTAEQGEVIYEKQCVMCHGDFGSGGGGYPALAKGNAYELQKTLTNNRYQNATGDGPTRVFGSYWPKVSTLWWYIRDGMPHPKSKVLSVNETYALTAYILNLNEIEVDGEMIESDTVLDREMMLKIEMPNNNGFVPNIDGPTAPDDVRTFYANPANFGAQKVNPSERCMQGCQEETAKVTHISGVGISNFLPPMATERNLPLVEETSGFDAKKVYEEACMMCHADASMGAPALGNAQAWAAYTAKGMDKVYNNGINGINAMPPKGGASLSDTEFKSVVDYIIDNSK